MSVAENLERLRASIPKEVTLVAVSKTKPVSMIEEALRAGQLDFGENRVQEMTAKQAQLPAEIRWHQIGTLQRNKVKYLAPFVHLIHSIDSLKLLQETNKQAAAYGRVQDVLLQMHIAEEETKFGLEEDGLRQVLDSPEFEAMRHIRVCGLMGMATLTENEGQIAREFSGLRHVFDRIKTEYGDRPNLRFSILSMGMSSDYRIAISEGSTLIRVGSALFGERS